MKIKTHIYTTLGIIIICPISQVICYDPGYHPEVGPLVDICTFLGIILGLFYFIPVLLFHLIYRKKAKEWYLNKSEKWQKSLKMWHIEADYIYTLCILLLSFGIGASIMIM